MRISGKTTLKHGVNSLQPLLNRPGSLGAACVLIATTDSDDQGCGRDNGNCEFGGHTNRLLRHQLSSPHLATLSPDSVNIRFQSPAARSAVYSRQRDGTDVTDEPTAGIPAWRRRRAEAFARHPIVRRPVLRSRFVHFSGARPSHDILDVGTGAGFSAFAFAKRAATVTAVDWRSELLEVGRRELSRRKFPNVSFLEAAPEELPFPEESFEIVSSAAAMHHFAHPARVIAEMARVCTQGGTIALEDIVTSEQAVRARYHNRLERLRDRSHQRLLALSEIVALLSQAGLSVRRVEVEDSLREYNEWVAVTRPPTGRSEHIRRLLQGSVEQDLGGLSVQSEDDTFLFVQQVAWVLAEKRG